MLCLFNVSHFSSTVCFAVMAKRSEKDSGEERVTAKSRPMMNLIARTPSFVSSSTSVSPEKKYYGNQDPWKSVAGEDRSGRPDKGTDLFEASDHYYHEQFMESFSSTNYSKLDYDRAWSSQEWKAEATTYDRSGRPDKTSWRMVRKFDLITKKFFSTEPRDPQGMEKHFVIHQGDLVISILKKWQIHKISSWEAIQQNCNCL